MDEKQHRSRKEKGMCLKETWVFDPSHKGEMQAWVTEKKYSFKHLNAEKL